MGKSKEKVIITRICIAYFDIALHELVVRLFNFRLLLVFLRMVLVCIHLVFLVFFPIDSNLQNPLKKTKTLFKLIKWLPAV